MKAIRHATGRDKESQENASETAQAKAFFEWLRLFSRMAVGGMIQSYEGPHGHENYVLDAIRATATT